MHVQIFLQECIAKYDEMREADEELVTTEPGHVRDEVERMSFKDIFHAKLPQDIVIDSSAKYRDTDESSDSKLPVCHYSGTPLFKFHTVFRRVLNEKYGFLHEKFLFGDADSGEAGTIQLLDDFKEVSNCTCLDDFKEFFSLKFDFTQNVSELHQCFSALYNEIANDSTTVQLQRLVVDKVAMFCYHLIDTRIRCMQSFENLEQSLHERFTGYDLLSKIRSIDKEYCKLLDKLSYVVIKYNSITDLTVFTNKERKVYKEQIDIYHQILSYLKEHKWIDNSDCTDVEYLLHSEHNHFSYLHEHILRLQQLLLPFKERYHVPEPSEENGHLIYSVKMVAGTISGALDALKGLMNKRKPSEIRLYADTALYGDANLEGKLFQGVNVACIAPIFVKKKISTRLKIVTDGKPLDGPYQTNSKASDGVSGSKYCKDGRDGADGINGRYGNAGGHILIVANNILETDFYLSANGSCGEDGQAGGNGGIGFTPDKVGKDGDSTSFTAGWMKTKDTVIINYGTEGEDGGKGGGAGWGGAGGKSGISGRIELLDLQNESNCKVTQELIDDGENGELGIPGEAGLNTRHGRDKGGYAEAPGFGGKFINFFTGKEKRKIYDAEGSLRHDSIPYNPGSGCNYERRGKGRPRVLRASDHPDFTNRGRQQRGRSAKVKINTAVANENKVISKHSCFQSLYNQCKNSVQHWNVKSHNQFLSAFAQRIGETHEYSTFVSITHSERMKFNSAIWIQRIQKQSEALQERMTAVHQTQHSMQTQVMLMKDYDDGSGYHKATTGYLGSESTHHQPLLLDVSSLEAAKELKFSLHGLSLEDLLLNDAHDQTVYELVQLDYPKETFLFVSGEGKLHLVSTKLVIFKNSSGSFFYHHPSRKALRISDIHVLEMLKEKSQKLSSGLKEIERDDQFYPMMVTFIRSQHGDDLELPFTPKQLVCVHQLQLLVAIRKTYNAIGRTLTEVVQRQGLLKLYGQYIDDVLVTKSSFALLSLEQDMITSNILIQPLDVSWISEDISCHSDHGYTRLSQCTEAFNKEPTPTSLLELILAFYTYHTQRVSTELHRLPYMRHLSTPKCLSGLHIFCNQLCRALFILGNEELIDSSVHDMPCNALSEAVLHKIALPAPPPEPNYVYYEGELQKQRPWVCTVVDDYLSLIDRTLKATIKLDSHPQHSSAPQNPSTQLTFEESITAFLTLRCNETMLTALQVYVSSNTSNPLAEHNDQLQCLLEWLYYALREHIINFDTHVTVTVLSQDFEDDVFNTLELLKNLKLLTHKFGEKSPIHLQITALAHSLELLRDAIIFPARGIKEDMHQIHSSQLLMSVTQFFEKLKEFCKEGLEGLTKNEKDETVIVAMSNLLEFTAEIHDALQNFPIACRANNFFIWEKNVKAIVKEFHTKSRAINHSSIVKMELEKLYPLLEDIQMHCSTLERFHHCIEWIRHCDDLQSYSKLFHADSDMKVKLFIHRQLDLEEKFLDTRCMDTLHMWLCPEPVWQPPQRITIIIERLMPSHDIIIVAKEPQESTQVQRPTIYLYPECEKWQLAFQEPNKSLCFRDVDSKQVNDAYLESVLGHNVRKHLHDQSSLEIPVEQAACLLSKLRYEEEMTIQHSVYFNEQTLVDEINSGFTILVVHMQTSEVVFYDHPTTANKIGEGDIVIIQGHCDSKSQLALKQLRDSGVLNITDQHLASLTGAKAMCLIKQPGQPVALRTVTQCGDRVEYDFAYQLPLITDLTSEESESFTEQFEPLSELLNGYVHNHFSMNKLNSALLSALDKHRLSLYQEDIFGLVRTIRSYFIDACFASRGESYEPEKIKAMQHPLKLLLESQYTSPIIEEMCLTGLESFSNFLIQRDVESKSVVAKRIKSMQKMREGDNEELWKAVIENCNPTPENAEWMYMAYAYLECPDEIDLGLLDNVISFTDRLEVYGMIKKGLHCLNQIEQTNSPVRKPKSHGISIKQALQQVSYYQHSYQIDALQEVSLTIEDKNNLGELLRIIQMEKELDTIREKLTNHLAEEPLKDSKTCTALLRNPHFYEYIYNMMLSWCLEQQKQLITKIQSYASDIAFMHASIEQREALVNSMSQWLMNKTGTKMCECCWEELLDLYRIGELICTRFRSQIVRVRNESASSTDPSKVLYGCLTLIQVIDATSSISSVMTIMQESSSDEWITILFIQNTLMVCVDHFYVESDEEKAIILEKLSFIDPKLLQIFFNIFVEDQYYHKNEENPIGMISLTQLIRILDWLPHVEPLPIVCSTLCTTAMSLWEKVLEEFHFKQFLDHWHDLSERDKKRVTFLLNRVRLEATTNFMLFMSTIKGKYISSGSNDSSPLLHIVEDLYYKRISLHEANNLVQNNEYNEWCTKLEILRAEKTDDKLKDRKVDEVIELIQGQVQSDKFQLSADTLDLIQHEGHVVTEQVAKLFEELNDTEDWSRLLKQKLKVCTGELQRQTSFDKKLHWLSENRVKFVVHLITAWMLINDKQRPYATQLVSLLLFLHTENQGLLQQVKTGEGKTLIVGFLAAAKALLGYNVDVVSSNRDLAQEGVEKCEKFFAALHLKAAINCDDDDSRNQQAYKSHIVYGDVGSFQRDVLKFETEAGSADYKKRYSDMTRTCLIVDEVDSMFLDKGRHMLYLSHESPALKHLESLFLVIWSSVLSIAPEELGEQVMVDAVLEQTATDLIKLIENKRISVPSYLTDFCKHKMQFWVRSAYQARFMEENDQFIIDRKTKDDADKSKQIFPVDKQTGVEEYNMKWSNGLSQFLELKYRHKLSTESLKAIFISNKRFFKRYHKCLYGLTGTLGSASSRNLLQEVYDVSTVELPTNKAKRFVQHKSHVAMDERGWCQVICKEIKKRTSGQPILVICENIKRLASLEKHLNSHKLNAIHYARHGDDVEKLFRDKGGASPDDIVLATNKGGRGTDIKIDTQNAPEGLHVIVTFLPENTRIEEQAFGRAARAGQAGSGCLVIQIDPDEYQSDIETFGDVISSTEILIEKEKIKRDQAESDRISLLLSDGIPQLDLEEGLYQLFQDKKKIFMSTVQRSRFSDAREACVEVFTDHWAYWLDSVTHQIQTADSPEKRKKLEHKFEELFSSLSETPPSFDDQCPFFKMPEHCIRLGQAYVDKKKFDDAKACFKMAMKRGDCTGFAAMAACYSHVKKDPDVSEENIKKVCQYLKSAKSHLDALRRSWMANGEIGKSLVDLIDVSHYVNTDENHYAEQVEDKLKVIGLHLNTLETLIGSSVDESSFIRESKITSEESKDIYYKLAEDGILHECKVRKLWKEQKAVESLLSDEVEPVIAKRLISLITERARCRDSIGKGDLEKLVCSSDELWQLLKPILSSTDEQVVVLELGNIDAKLHEKSLQLSWGELKQAFSDELNSSSSLVLCHGHPMYTQLQEEKYEKLVIHLKSNAFYRDTRRAKIKLEALERMDARSGVPYTYDPKHVELKHYEHCTMKDENGNDQQLREHLTELLRYCFEHESGYCYEYMLPFDSRDAEAEKLLAFIKEKDILKSGGLISAYKKDMKALKSRTESALSMYTPEQQVIVFEVLQSLPGEIHRFERKMMISFVDFFDIEDRPDDPPESLECFTAWHLDYFLTLKQEEKGWWDWNAFAVAMIGLAQVIAGAVLIALTAGGGTQIGSGLISEGINDMVYATIAGITGTFSWKDWAIQKAISVAISIATGGLSGLASLGKAAVKVGSASRFCIFAKTMLKAAGEFICNATASIISDVVLAEVQERVVSAIVDYIEESLFSRFDTLIRSRLIEIAQTAKSLEDFNKSCENIHKSVRKALKQSPLLPEAFDTLRTQVASSLQQNYKAIADGLSKSGSKWAKLASAGAKAAVMANQVYEAVSAGIDIWQAVDALVKILPSEIQHTDQVSGHMMHLSEGDIDRYQANIKQLFQEFIQEHIQKKLKGILERIIKGSMKAVAKASKKAVSNVVKTTFGKTSAQVVKDLKDKRASFTVLRDYDDEDQQQHKSKEKTGESKASTNAEKKQQAYKQKREKYQSTVLKPDDKDRHKEPTSDRPPPEHHEPRSERSPKEHSSSGINKEELHKVRGALQNSKSKLASTHAHKPENKATGYYSHRGEPLERMPEPRKRAGSAGHLHMPTSYYEQIGEKPKPLRRHTNVIRGEAPEVKQPGIPGNTAKAKHISLVFSLSVSVTMCNLGILT